MKKNTKDILTYKFNNHNVRIAADEFGNAWLVADDVAHVLGYDETWEIIDDYVDLDYTNIYKIDINGRGKVERIVINKEAFPMIVALSYSPLADQFNEWVENEALPSFHKNSDSIARQKEMEAFEIKGPALPMADSKSEGNKAFDDERMETYSGNNTTAKTNINQGKINKMNNEIQTYNFNGNDIRTLTDEQGEPWFLGHNVCKVLGISSVKDAYKRLADSEKSYVGRTLLGLKPGKQMLLVSESGLYKLIMRSDKPEALEFQDWLTQEVLPSIRKHGMYATPETAMELMSDPRQLAKMLNEFANAKEKIAEDAPKVEQYDAFMNSEGLFSITKLAKTIGVGPKNLAEYMRHKNILYQRKKSIMPKEPYAGRYFKVTLLLTHQGTEEFHGRLTPEGFDHFLKRFKDLTNEIIRETLSQERRYKTVN